MNTIAVVQYNWALHGYTRDLVVGLADHGYQVLFFIDQVSLHSGLINIATLQHPNVVLHTLKGYLYWRRRPLLRQVCYRLFWEIGALINSPFWLVSWRDYLRLRRQL